MKILQINSVCGIKSTGRICTDIAEVLNEQGHECKIAYGRETAPQKFEKYAYRIGSDTNVKIHALFSRIFDNSGFMSKSATKKLIKEIKNFLPDIIHLHNIHGYYININLLFEFLKEYNKPVVWTLHDCWAFTGHCAHFDYIGCEKWKKGGCENCPQSKEYPASLVFDRSEKNFRLKKEIFTSVENLTVVTPSEWLSRLVKKSFLNKYPVCVINNGIDTNVFVPTESDFKKKYGIENKKMLLFVASVWDRKKGLEDIYELNKILPDEYVLVVVGLNDKQKNVLPDGIIGITRTDSTKELAEIYSAADMFINPTLEDNYPTVNLEALSCHTPVITYNTGGSPESVTDKLGVVVNERTPKALCEAIKKYDMNTFDPKGIDFDKNNRFKEYIELYEEKCRC